MQTKRTLFLFTVFFLLWVSTADLMNAQAEVLSSLTRPEGSAVVVNQVADPKGSIADEPDDTVHASLPLYPVILISDGFGWGFDPAIAYNSKHDEYLVVWGDPYNLYARRVSSRGELLGSEFTVASNTLRDMEPSVAYDFMNDRYLVVWTREIIAANYDIYGRFIPWDGSGAAAEFPIDTATSDSSSIPKVVYNGGREEYLVVWEDAASGWPEYRVRGRRIFAVGGGWPAKFLIASNPSQNRRNPDVAYNQFSDQYLVVFDNFYASDSTNNENIYGQRLAWDGSLVGGEFTIAGWPEDELVPSVSACYFNQYLVTWTSVKSGGNLVYGYYVDGDGSLLTVHQIDDGTTGFPYAPVALTCKGGYQYMLAWEKYDGGTKVGISGRIAQLNATFEPTVEFAAPNNPHREKPAVACSGVNCLVAWEHRNDTGYAEINGRIYGETKPTAAFTINPTTGTTGTTFTFDASSSTDLEDASADLRVRWDWQDDGTYDTNWSTTQTATHQFMIPCSAASLSKTPRLEVKDTYGLTDSTSKSISVGNSPPTAAFTVTPEVGENSTAFQFDASSSSDVECQVGDLQVRWDWENDGTWDTPWSFNKTSTMTFTNSGYGYQTIKLEVRDGAGLTAATTHDIKIDQPPTAAFTVTPASGFIGTVFTFDPSSSTDPNIGYYWLFARWDWEDDGTWDTDWLRCSDVVTHSYWQAGTHTVRLAVREYEPSLIDTTTHTVTVEPGFTIFMPILLR